MNLSAFYSSVISVYPLKIPLSSDKLNVSKMSPIEDRGHLFNGATGISCIFCSFNPLQTDKMVVFDNLI